MKSIRIGVLGAASIATRSIIPEIYNLKNKFDLVGVASRDKNKVNALSKKYDTKAFLSYDDLINYSKLDAIYIPLPNALHYKYAKQSLEKGIHVLVEKSIGCNLNEVEELVKIAKKKDLMLMENFQFRFHSQLDFLKSLLNDGVIGEKRAMISSFCFPPFQDKNNIRYNSKLGGGALLDAGAYTTKISSILLGDNLYVKSAILNHNSSFGVDVCGSAFLVNYENYTTSTCIFGFDNFYQCGVQILGSKGKITTNRLFTAREDFYPSINLEIAGKKNKKIELKPDNHFRKMLLYFSNSIFDKKLKTIENNQNLIQARLLQEIKDIDNEK